MPNLDACTLPLGESIYDFVVDWVEIMMTTLSMTWVVATTHGGNPIVL